MALNSSDHVFVADACLINKNNNNKIMQNKTIVMALATIMVVGTIGFNPDIFAVNENANEASSANEGISNKKPFQNLQEQIDEIKIELESLEYTTEELHTLMSDNNDNSVLTIETNDTIDEGAYEITVTGKTSGENPVVRTDIVSLSIEYASDPFVATDKQEYAVDAEISLNIFGLVENPGDITPVSLEMIRLNNSPEILNTKIENDGTFEVMYVLDDDDLTHNRTLSIVIITEPGPESVVICATNESLVDGICIVKKPESDIITIGIVAVVIAVTTIAVGHLKVRKPKIKPQDEREMKVEEDEDYD